VNRILIIITISICLFHEASGQVKATTIQSVFIYSALKYMEWPDDGSSDFNIAILGESSLFDELAKLAKIKKVGNRNIVVRKVNSVNEVVDCHILFISADKAASLSKVVSSPNKSILIITETEGAIGKGSDLNFIQRGEKMTFQMSENSLVNKKIKVSSSFSVLAEK
jgi:hypothetical protein